MRVHWRIELLGGVRAICGERVVARFRSRKVAALLGYLASRPRRTHLRESLVELLWPECEPGTGLARLSRLLYLLRRELEPTADESGTVVLADRQAIGLDPGAVTTDVVEFESAVRTAHGAATAEIARLRETVALYGGEFMAGHYDDWVVAEQRRLSELFHQAATALLEALRQAGELSAAVECACQIVRTDPLREDMQRTLMELYVQTGHPELALRQYRELREVLREQLSTAPSAATREVALQAKRAREQKPRPAAAARVATVSPPQPAALPVGTVTLVVADTMEERGETGKGAPAGTSAGAAADLFRQLTTAHGGASVPAGALLAGVFASAEDALSCAMAAHTGLAERGRGESWRVALDTGCLALHKGTYEGAALDSVRDLLQAARAGQTLCSERTALLGQLGTDSELKLTDLGRYRLGDAGVPQRVFQILRPGQTEEDTQAPQALPTLAPKLPRPLTRLFGREPESDSLERLLAEERTRLLTLTGLGGIGKSRLTLEVGRRLLRPFRGAVCWVPLADVAEPGLIVEALLGALGLPRLPHREPLEQATEWLNRQPTLLLVDNMEHLLPDGADVIRRVLECTADVCCLVTSRARLGLAGEREFRLTPLPTPLPSAPLDEQLACDSVRMFADLAEAASPSFELCERNAEAVVELCVRLEGLPLALELAAARAGTTSVAQMLQELGERFELLVSKQTGRPGRHRSLYSALEWSHRLLAPEVQTFLDRLSVFQGGCTADVAEEVCQEPLALDYLVQLREVSLLEGGLHTPGDRFRMLDTVREFAAGKLGTEGSAETQRRHADYYKQMVFDAFDELRGPRQALWLSRYDRELGNLRAAFAWCLEEEPEWALKIAVNMWRYWDARGGWQEGRTMAEESARRAHASNADYRGRAAEVAGFFAAELGDIAAALGQMEQSVALYREAEHDFGVASVQNRMAWVLLGQGEYDRAEALLREAAECFRESSVPVAVAHAVEGLGVIASARGEYAQARRLYRESLAVSREVGHEADQADTLYRLGLLESDAGNEAEARRLHDESLELGRKIDSKPRIAQAVCAQGSLALRRGDLAAAREHFTEALATAQEEGSVDGVAEAQRGLGQAATAAGDLAEARALLTEALRVQQERGYRHAAATTLSALSELACEEGDDEAAAHHLGAAAALREALGAPLPTSVQEAHEQRTSHLRQRLGEAALRRAWDEGAQFVCQDWAHCPAVPR